MRELYPTDSAGSCAPLHCRWVELGCSPGVLRQAYRFPSPYCMFADSRRSTRRSSIVRGTRCGPVKLRNFFIAGAGIRALRMAICGASHRSAI
jgi:hypothetical protein